MLRRQLYQLGNYQGLLTPITNSVVGEDLPCQGISKPFDSLMPGVEILSAAITHLIALGSLMASLLAGVPAGYG
ncbi:hypothetical protein CQ12_25290 [Bradyrhizobium jicamae]|uniref:Uncharacterized protein n=2 Tax=Bradyrhizobium jicamae TaxID=280332 RepID=A0A0R3LQZ3_9BRAD|nr:hypothetical protein CQ12_25290 [Bradyrhizobium jicamae]